MDADPSVSDDATGNNDQSSNQLIDFDEALQVLKDGDIELITRMPYSSNATFLVQVDTKEQSVRGIYKPVEGERPLWDFPSGLHRREIAAYELSQQLGWNVVPQQLSELDPTELVRSSCSLTLTLNNTTSHWLKIRGIIRVSKNFAFSTCWPTTPIERQAIVCLPGRSSIFGIDHGLCFPSEFKLRTVIWDFANQPISDALMRSRTGLRGLGQRFEGLA